MARETEAELIVVIVPLDTLACPDFVGRLALGAWLILLKAKPANNARIVGVDWPTLMNTNGLESPELLYMIVRKSSKSDTTALSTITTLRGAASRAAESRSPVNDHRGRLSDRAASRRGGWEPFRDF